jgi:hypothetical protein
MERRAWPVVLLALGLGVAAMLILFFLSKQHEGPVNELAAVVEAGETRLITVPSGFVHNIQVDDEGVVRVFQPLNLEVAVAPEAECTGMTTVRLHDCSGTAHTPVHVRVVPKSREVVEEDIRLMSLPVERKRELALRSMLVAKLRREEGRLVAARTQLERAHMLYTNLRDHEGANKALQQIERIDQLVDERYDELTFEMMQFVKDGDMKMALRRLEELRALLPDPDDIRRQNVDLLARLLRRKIEQQRRR